jgi:hypothetical protein
MSHSEAWGRAQAVYGETKIREVVENHILSGSDVPVVGDLTFGQAVIPEPGGLTLLGIGLASIGGYGWRRRQRANAS